jgi:hypothetical protein
MAKYIPKARLLGSDGSSFWNDTLYKVVLGSKKAGQWLEVDWYELAKNAIKSLMDEFTTGSGGVALETLQQIAASGKSAILPTLPVAYVRPGLDDGRQSVYEAVVDTMTTESSTSTKLDVKHHLLYSASDILRKSSRDDVQLKLRRSLDVHNLLSDLWDNENYQRTAQEFVKRFTDRE